MIVKDNMTPHPITVAEDADIQETFTLLQRHGIHQVPVLRDAMVVGIVTDRDLRIGLLRTDLGVSDIMTPNPVTLFEDVNLDIAAQLMLKRKFNAIPVVDRNGFLTGIITMHDILNFFLKKYGVAEELIKARVAIPLEVAFEEVLRTFQTSSDKFLSFIKIDEGDNDYIFWLVDCDFEKVERMLKERGLEDVVVTLYA